MGMETEMGKLEIKGDNLREKLVELHKITYSMPAIARALGGIVSSAHLQNYSAGRYDISPPTKREISERLEQITEKDIYKHIRRRGRPRKQKKEVLSNFS